MRVIGSNGQNSKSSLKWEKRQSLNVDEPQSLYIVSAGNSIVSRSVDSQSKCDIPLECSGSVNISHVDVSLDGTLIIFSCVNPQPDIFVRSSTSGDVIHRFEDHDHGIAGFAISHDSRYLMSVGDSHDRKVIVFDVNTGDIVAKSVLGTTQAIHAVISGGFVLDAKNRPTSKYMYVTCGMNHMNIWEFDPSTRQLDWRSVVGRHVREFTCVCLLQGLLFAGTTTGDIISVIMKSQTVSSSTIPVSGSGGVSTITSDDDHLVVVGSMDGSITVFRLENSRLVYCQKLFLEKNSAITSVSLKTEGDKVYVLVGNGSGGEFLVTISKASTLPCTARLIRQVPFMPICDILIHEKSRRIIVASSDIHNSFDEGVTWSRFFSNPATTASCCTANSNLVVAGYDEKILGLDAKTGSFLWTIPFEAKTSRIDVSNKHHLLVGSVVGDVCLYDLRSKQMKSRSKDCNSQITRVKFFSDDQFCIASGGRSIVTYDLHASKRITHHRERNLGINGFSLFSDQTSVVSIGAEKVVSFWDLRVHEPVSIVPTEIEFTAVSLREPHIAFGTIGGSVAVWDCRKADWMVPPITTSVGQRVNAIQWLNSNQVISGGNDNCVTIHDPLVPVSEDCKEGIVAPVLGKLELPCVVHAD